MTSPTIRSVAELAEAGLVTPAQAPALETVTGRYALAITPAMTGIIDRTDPADPIARQFVPSLEELVTTDGEKADPIGDRHHSPVEGIVHRYPGRVLLKIVHVCPVYCRFCFRREMVGPGGEPSLSPEALDTALAYVAARPQITEVILTGGDPFVLAPRRVAELTTRLAGISHVNIVRWHTRVPVVDPGRVTRELVEALRAPGIATWVAIHANHEREFSPAARSAIAMLADAGIPLLGQSVLLRGVNDSVGALASLMNTLIENRIKPYYLHHADLAPGTSHFRTTIAHGQELMRGLRKVLSGIAIPTYVLDLPGGHSKASLEDAGIEPTSPGSYRIRDDHGHWHDYTDQV